MSVSRSPLRQIRVANGPVATTRRRSAGGEFTTDRVTIVAETDPQFHSYGNNMFLGDEGIGIGDPVGWPDLPSTAPSASRAGITAVTTGQDPLWVNEYRTYDRYATDFTNPVNIMEEDGPDGYLFTRQLLANNQQSGDASIEGLVLRLYQWSGGVLASDLEYSGEPDYLGNTQLTLASSTEHIIESTPASSVALAMLDRDDPTAPALLFYALGSQVYARQVSAFTATADTAEMERWIGFDPPKPGPVVFKSERVAVGTCKAYGTVAAGGYWRNALYAVNVEPGKVLLAHTDGSSAFLSLWTATDGLPTRLTVDQVVGSQAVHISQLMAKEPWSTINTDFVFTCITSLNANRTVKVEVDGSNGITVTPSPDAGGGAGFGHASWCGDKIMQINSGGPENGVYVLDPVTLDRIQHFVFHTDLTADVRGPYAGIGLPDGRWVVGVRDSTTSDVDTDHPPFGYTVVEGRADYMTFAFTDGTLTKIDQLIETTNSQNGLATTAHLLDRGGYALFLCSTDNRVPTDNELPMSWGMVFAQGTLKPYNFYGVTAVDDEWFVISHSLSGDEGWSTYPDVTPTPTNPNPEDRRWFQAFHLDSDGVVDRIGKLKEGQFSGFFHAGMCRVGPDGGRYFFTLGRGDETEALYVTVSGIQAAIWQIGDDGTLTRTFVVDIQDDLNPPITDNGTHYAELVPGTTDRVFAISLGQTALDTIALYGHLFAVDVDVGTITLLDSVELDPAGKFPGFGDGRDPHQIISFPDGRMIVTYCFAKTGSSGNWQRHMGIKIVGDTISHGSPIEGGDFLGATNYRGDLLNDTEMGYLHYEDARPRWRAGIVTTRVITDYEIVNYDYDSTITDTAPHLIYMGEGVVDLDAFAFDISAGINLNTIVGTGDVVFRIETVEGQVLDQEARTISGSTLSVGLAASSSGNQRLRLVIDGPPGFTANMSSANFWFDEETTIDPGNPFINENVTYLAVVGFENSGLELNLRNVPVVVGADDFDPTWLDYIIQADQVPGDGAVWAGEFTDTRYCNLMRDDEGDYRFNHGWEIDLVSFQDGTFYALWGMLSSPTDAFVSTPLTVNRFTYSEGDDKAYWVAGSQRRMLYGVLNPYPWGSVKMGDTDIVMFTGFGGLDTRAWAGGFNPNNWALCYRVFRTGAGRQSTTAYNLGAKVRREAEEIR